MWLVVKKEGGTQGEGRYHPSYCVRALLTLLLLISFLSSPNAGGTRKETSKRGAFCVFWCLFLFLYGNKVREIASSARTLKKSIFLLVFDLVFPLCEDGFQGRRAFPKREKLSWTMCVASFFVHTKRSFELSFHTKRNSFAFFVGSKGATQVTREKVHTTQGEKGCFFNTCVFLLLYVYTLSRNKTWVRPVDVTQDGGQNPVFACCTKRALAMSFFAWAKHKNPRSIYKKNRVLLLFWVVTHKVGWCVFLAQQKAVKKSFFCSKRAHTTSNKAKSSKFLLWVWSVCV